MFANICPPKFPHPEGHYALRIREEGDYPKLLKRWEWYRFSRGSKCTFDGKN